MESATIRWVGGQEFLARMPSGHSVSFDGDRNRNSAPSPMEMLLGALGACTAIDVAIILAKKRQKLESFDVVVSGERAADPPRVWTRLEIAYKLRGKLNEKAVRDAIELSETKYCSVAAMLRQAAPISFRYDILPAGS